MAQPDIDPAKFAKLSKEYAQLDPVVSVAKDYVQAVRDKADLESMMADAEMKALAQDELYALNAKLPDIEHAMKLALLPRDEADAGSAILEIRAGTGGDEAALFAADLFRMYKNYAGIKGWKFDVMEVSESDLGGLKDVVVSVEGTGVFARLKYESGVHRVQRVPATEASGRVHTSAATVAVLPEAEDVDIDIRPEDLRIDTYRASGSGGQHVNRTDSAVRITHIPTNTVVAMQEEKSQIKNREKAMKILRSRIYEAERQRLHDTRAADRKSQVGSGDRSERIRTYNFPQGRITDHRVNLTLQKLERVLAGTDLDEVVDALVTADQLEQLTSMGL